MGEIIFNNEEKEFIDEHNLNIEDFYDGRGESKEECHMHAKEAGCDYIIGNYCHEGHRLKTRSGHCIVCRPSAMAFQKRFSRSGVVYVASCGEYSKVGVVDVNTFSPRETLRHREGSLNGEGGYGGVTGWKILAWFEVDRDLGKIESEIHSKLSDYSVDEEYYHDSGIRVAKEILLCSADKAINVINCYYNVVWNYSL